MQLETGWASALSRESLYFSVQCLNSARCIPSSILLGKEETQQIWEASINYSNTGISCNYSDSVGTVCRRARGAWWARCGACAEMQPTRAAPDTARACSLSVGHAGLHTSGTSAAPNGLQLLGEADARRRGTQISARCHPQLGTFRAAWMQPVVLIQQ